MRDVKLQVETIWHATTNLWTVKIWMVVSPHARYPITEFTTSFSDPMLEVVERLRGLFE